MLYDTDLVVEGMNQDASSLMDIDQAVFKAYLKRTTSKKGIALKQAMKKL